MWKYSESDGGYVVQFSKRHPITRKPVKLLRRRNDKGKPIKSETEARKIYAQLVAKVEDKLRETIIPLWPEMIDKYCEHAIEIGLMQKTVENYRLGLNAHTRELWADRRVDAITTAEIRELVTETLSKKAESHKQNVLKFIRAVFKLAVEQGIIQRNPTPDIRFRKGDKIKQGLNESQVRLLLERAKDLECEWYPVWSAALYTGMRSGELFALTWDNVDLENRKIFVKWSWNNKDGFKETKSGDDRVVEIAPALMPVMKELKRESSGETNFVLPRLRKWEKGEQARELRLFLMGLNLPAIRFHDLRATWATLLLGRGIEPIKVMYAGGWKDMKTMMIYMRKAGIEIQGMTDGFNLHDPSREKGKIVALRKKM